jgi:hypothetical protein
MTTTGNSNSSMTRAEIIELITRVVGDELTLLRADVERLVALKPVPPFVPPQPWQAERLYTAGLVVRHRNGLFSARRDTLDEPPTDAWLPLIVGVASVEMEMDGDRTVVVRSLLSDGQCVEAIHHVALPIVRGNWNAEADYSEGDRVFCHGEWHALAPSRGVEPGSSDATWLKVGGRIRKPLALALDADGTMTEAGHAIGSIKPLVRDLLADLVAKHARQAP